MFPRTPEGSGWMQVCALQGLSVESHLPCNSRKAENDQCLSFQGKWLLTTINICFLFTFLPANHSPNTIHQTLTCKPGWTNACWIHTTREWCGLGGTSQLTQFQTAAMGRGTFTKQGMPAFQRWSQDTEWGTKRRRPAAAGGPQPVVRSSEVSLGTKTCPP